MVTDSKHNLGNEYKNLVMATRVQTVVSRGQSGANPRTPEPAIVSDITGDQEKSWVSTFDCDLLV